MAGPFFGGKYFGKGFYQNAGSFFNEDFFTGDFFLADGMPTEPVAAALGGGFVIPSRHADEELLALLIPIFMETCFKESL